MPASNYLSEIRFQPEYIQQVHVLSTYQQTQMIRRPAYDKIKAALFSIGDHQRAQDQMTVDQNSSNKHGVVKLDFITTVKEFFQADKLLR